MKTITLTDHQRDKILELIARGESSRIITSGEREVLELLKEFRDAEDVGASDLFGATAEFNQAIVGIDPPTFPRILNRGRKAWFVTALREEVQELEDATNMRDEVDAIMDLLYFAAGRIYEMGVNPVRALATIHGPNMRKVRGELSKRPGAQGYDAVKPKDWVGPDWSWLPNTRRTVEFGKLLGTRPSAPKPVVLSPVPPYVRNGKEIVDETYGAPPGMDKPADPNGFMKFDDGKECMPELIPAPFLDALGRLYAKGAKKYAAENWRKGSSYQRYVGALLRHLNAWRNGEEIDAVEKGGTGEHHLVAVAWNAVTLFMQLELGIGEDDRPDKAEQITGEQITSEHSRRFLDDLRCGRV